MHLLLDLAARTGRHVGPHISMLLSSLEAAGLLPSEADAQEELGMGEEDAGSEGEEGIEDLFGFEDAQHLVRRGCRLPPAAWRLVWCRHRCECRVVVRHRWRAVRGRGWGWVVMAGMLAAPSVVVP